MNDASRLRVEIDERINEVFETSDSNVLTETTPTLPMDDPPMDRFLHNGLERQGIVGYCLRPLIEYVDSKLDGGLSFIVLTHATPQQLRPDLLMSELNFCAINNQPAHLQLLFRKIFRFVSSSNFSRTSIQTSKILFEHPSKATRSFANYIYCLDDEPTSKKSDLNIIPVKELAKGILDSDFFKGLDNYLHRALPENINEELGRQFERFFKDGDLEKEVLAQRSPGAEDFFVTAPHPVVETVNKHALQAFEPLLVAFGFKRSAELRRRFLNYFAWMMLCDKAIKFYAYFASIESGLPQSEFVIASTASLDIQLATVVKKVVSTTLSQIYSKMYEVDFLTRDHSNTTVANLPATLNAERKAIHKLLADGKRDENGVEINSRKATAVLGLDEVINSYVGPIVTKAFPSPHQRLSLEPLWKGTMHSPDVLNDLTFNALRDEFATRNRPPQSRVNPFLMAMCPVSQYLSQEMESLRQPNTLAESKIQPERFFRDENRLPGELPLDPSGLLSMNVVFWDIATRQFKYCSVSFVNNDALFRHSFAVFFRLIEDVEPGTVGRGILDSVLLMSDILFRESVGEIKPTSVIFTDPKRMDVEEKKLSKRYPPLSVAPFIDFLDAEDGARHDFDEFYHYVLMTFDGSAAKKKEIQVQFDNLLKSIVPRFTSSPRSGQLVKDIEKFLREHQSDLDDPAKAGAKFLGYITWLWLCYRDRLAYYYYIPAQLPFNERVGGFAIATETPIPDDIVEFLFISVAPRIVAHPALLYHREAVARLSRKIPECWFDSLPHLIANTLGIKELKRNLDDIIENLGKVDITLPDSERVLNIARRQLERASERLRRATPLANRLGSMFETQDENNLLTLKDVIEVCSEITTGYALANKVNIVYPKEGNSTFRFADIRVHSPVVLVLLHLALNACDAASRVPNERRVRVAVELVQQEHENGVQIRVFNRATKAWAAPLLEGAKGWHGLMKDRATLEVLWDHNPKMRSSEPIIPRVDCDESGLCEVEIAVYVPARLE